MADDDLPPLPLDRMTDAQRVAAGSFAELRGTAVFGPFVPLLRSPELMTLTAALGEYLRFRSALGPRLRELAILVTSREWTQQFEWDVHARAALTAGLSTELVGAIASGRRPEGMGEDEASLYDLCLEMHRKKTVTDAVYARAVERLGEQAVVDAVAICGYYALLAIGHEHGADAVAGGPSARSDALAGQPRSMTRGSCSPPVFSPR